MDAKKLVAAIRKEEELKEKRNFTFRISPKAHENFADFCELNNVTLSRLIEEWMLSLPVSSAEREGLRRTEADAKRIALSAQKAVEAIAKDDDLVEVWDADDDPPFWYEAFRKLRNGESISAVEKDIAGKAMKDFEKSNKKISG